MSEVETLKKQVADISKQYRDLLETRPVVIMPTAAPGTPVAPRGALAYASLSSAPVPPSVPPTPPEPPRTLTRANADKPGLLSFLGSDYGKALLQIGGAILGYVLDNAGVFHIPPELAAVIGLAIGHTISNGAATTSRSQ